MTGRIRTMRINDLDEIVLIHKKAFASFFLTFLGDAFLEVLYSEIIKDNECVAIVLETGDSLVGYVAGCLAPQGFYKRLLLRKWYRFLLASLTRVLQRPATILRLFRALKRPVESDYGSGIAELMSVAVLPEQQHFGYGSRLVLKFVKIVKENGGKGVMLSTDAEDNRKVNHFYHQIGFELNESYSTPEQRKMNRYLLLFNS